MTTKSTTAVDPRCWDEVSHYQDYYDEFPDIGPIFEEMQGEARIRWAVIQRALFDVLEIGARWKENMGIKSQEAWEWLNSLDTHPYSFLNLCETLSIDPNKIVRFASEWRGRRQLAFVDLKSHKATVPLSESLSSRCTKVS